MKYFLRIFILLFSIPGMLFFNACNKETTNQPVDCSQCFTVAPDSGFLALHLTINPENPRIPVTVYQGNVEDHQIIFRDTLKLAAAKILMPANQSYAVTATYIRGIDTIIAVDGTKLEVKKAAGQCGKTCYVVLGGYLDLRLKN